MASRPDITNQQIANVLNSIADQLHEQQANPFRINAYRNAATTIQKLDHSVAASFAATDRAEAEHQSKPLDALEQLPGIGQRLAATIEEIVRTGSCTMLNRLNGKLDPEALFCQVPSIGPTLARQIHEHLHIASLVELENCAYDGRLSKVPGIGPRRLEAIKMGLASLLRRSYPKPNKSSHRPSVGDILYVDKQYRHKAESGELTTIAPTRFNPNNEAWLPVWHTHHNNWEFTALFSNTARAHELQRTHDWVVVYFEDELHHEGQATIVTEYRGELQGERVVRGREQECAAFYAGQHQNTLTSETAA